MEMDLSCHEKERREDPKMAPRGPLKEKRNVDDPKTREEGCRKETKTTAPTLSRARLYSRLESGRGGHVILS